MKTTLSLLLTLALRSSIISKLAVFIFGGSVYLVIIVVNTSIAPDRVNACFFILNFMKQTDHDQWNGFQ